MSSHQLESRAIKYIKAFAKISIYIAVLSTLVMSVKIGLLHALISGIIISLTGTIFMALILVPIDYIATKNIPIEATNIKQARNVNINGDIDSIHAYCIKVVKSMDIVTIENCDIFNIIAYTKTNLWSFGERLSLKLSQLSPDTININITSQPKIKYTMLDYGKNFKNVEYIAKEICKYP